MRVAVKRILKKHGYPADKQTMAVKTVLEQANIICEEWAETSA
jgi:type I restriction enzyme, R subunit